MAVAKALADRSSIQRRVRYPLSVLLVALALLAAACSSGGDDTPSIAEQGPAIIPNSTTTAVQATREAELAAPIFEGEVTNRFNLEPGDCFNDYVWHDRAQNPQQATTRVNCANPHEFELYFTIEHPAPVDRPFVGDAELEDFARDACYKNFGEFVGMNYEESALEIGLIYPDLLAWGTDLARDVSCYVYPWEGGLLRGSMRGIAQ